MQTFLLDRDGVVDWANFTLYRHLDELLGTRLAEWLDDPDPLLGCLARARVTLRPERFETVAHGKCWETVVQPLAVRAVCVGYQPDSRVVEHLPGSSRVVRVG